MCHADLERGSTWRVPRPAAILRLVTPRDLPKPEVACRHDVQRQRLQIAEVALHTGHSSSLLQHHHAVHQRHTQDILFPEASR